MFVDTLRRLTSGPKPIALLFLLLFTSLYLMSSATQNSELFGRLYSLLLVINLFALLLLLALIARNLVGLIMQYRKQTPGSRLTVRLVVMLVILAVTPVSLLFYFSVQFLHRGIDSWFDLPMDAAMESSLQLGRDAIDNRLRERLRQTRLYGQRLSPHLSGDVTLQLSQLLQEGDASEMTLFTLQGRVLTSGSRLGTEIVPTLPDDTILRQLRQGLDYTAIEPLTDGRLYLRVAITITPPGGGDAAMLQALYPLEQHLAGQADQVQAAYARYSELVYLRGPLIDSFTLTLSLVLLMSLLTAVWAAFFSARRLVAPISDLAEGTRAVAAGDYDKQLPLPSRDELGFLVRSFNEMTRKIAFSRDQARQSQQQLLEQHAYLETVLGHLSSGVLTLNHEGVLYTVNASAPQILGVELSSCLDEPLSRLAEQFPALSPLVQAILPHLDQHDSEWREELVLFGSGGRQILMCRGSSLPSQGEEPGGHVIIFDDLTTLLQAQRDAAWGEVARRLAHEIKNPLTPIQLSAERLRRRYLEKLAPEEAEVLDRATHTIVQQVEAMKEMVQAFSEYARTPQLRLVPLNLNDLVREVLELYRDSPQLKLRCQLGESLPLVEADAGRLRQLLHNLIKNAIEAHDSGEPTRLELSTQCLQQKACRLVEFRVRDHGPGFPEELLENLFEPYVSSKPKGTGLGLAVVKKIVEEHGGIIWAENLDEGGAQITIRLPVERDNGDNKQRSAAEPAS